MVAKVDFLAGSKRTVNNTAIVSIADSSGGTGSDAIAAIGATYDQAEVRNAVASLSDKLEEVIVALEAAGIVTT